MLGYSLRSTDGKVLGSNEGTKLGYTDGKVLVTTLEDVDGITLGIDMVGSTHRGRGVEVRRCWVPCIE